MRKCSECLWMQDNGECLVMDIINFDEWMEDLSVDAIHVPLTNSDGMCKDFTYKSYWTAIKSLASKLFR